MPINYAEYHPKWGLISRLIRYRRAKNRCEWCGAPNGSVIRWNKDGTYRTPNDVEWDMINAKRRGGYSLQQAIKKIGFTRVVLTVAHLDHNKHNNRFDNLAALCQREHLGHDMQQHIANRKYGRNWKGKQQLKLDI